MKNDNIINIAVTTFSTKILTNIDRGNLRGKVAKVLQCDIVVNEFNLQSRYYVHFKDNTLGKGMKPLFSSAIG